MECGLPDSLVPAPSGRGEREWVQDEGREREEVGVSGRQRAGTDSFPGSRTVCELKLQAPDVCPIVLSDLIL